MNAAAHVTARANDRAITGLTAICHGLLHAYELSIPILMTVWLQELGVSKAVLGVAVTTGYALFGLGALPGGVLADRFGSRRLIMGCLLGMGGAFLLLSMAQGLILITVALVLWGAAASVYHPAGLALISKGAARRGHVFAYHGMAGNVGTALGPLATTLLLPFFDWRVVSALLALPALGALLLTWRLHVDEAAALSAQEQQALLSTSAFSWAALGRGSRQLFASAFLIVFAIMMLSGLFYRGVLTFLPELLSGFSTLEPVQLGQATLEPGRYVYVGLLLVGVGGQYVGGRLTDRLPVEWGIAGAFAALTGVALLYLPMAHLGLAPLLGISAALGFFLFGVQPLYQAAVAEYTPAGARGLSYGYTYLGVFGVGALGAALTGLLLDLQGAPVLFAVLAALSGTAAAAALVLRRRTAEQASVAS